MRFHFFITRVQLIQHGHIWSFKIYSYYRQTCYNQWKGAVNGIEVAEIVWFNHKIIVLQAKLLITCVLAYGYGKPGCTK